MMCEACQKGKQTKAQHKKTIDILTSKPLELLHVDLIGPTQTVSIGGKKYIMIIIDDYSKYTWVILLRDKFESFDLARKLFRRLQTKRISISIEPVVIMGKNLKILIFHYFMMKRVYIKNSLLQSLFNKIM